MIRSVNWHFTSKCNYNCKFCCTQKMKGEMEASLKPENIYEKLNDLGIEKVNFVGGEPFMSPRIFELVEKAKEMGFTTSIVTNGSLVDNEKLKRISPYLDWIGISVDSASEIVEKKLGRGLGKHIQNSIQVARLAEKCEIKLKINTTVTKLSINEYMGGLINELNPERWKVFQFMHVPGQNDEACELFSITDEEFNNYKKRNSEIRLKNGKFPVFESSAEMLDSYFMLSPSGCVHINTEYPGIDIPLESVTRDNIFELINSNHYFQRGGIYNWNGKNKNEFQQFFLFQFYTDNYSR
nr:viperin family antiviral radical SAM protein [Methanomicrobium sp. W14]